MRDLTSELATLAHDTALAPFLRAGVAVILWSADGARVLWASQAAGPVIAAVAPGHIVADDMPLRQRLKALAADLAPRRGIRLERLRFGRDLEQTITCACQTIVLPEDGSTALLTAVVGRLPERLADERPFLVDDIPQAPAASAPDAALEQAPASQAPASQDPGVQAEPPAPDAVPADAQAPVADDPDLAALRERAAARPRWRFTWASDADGLLTQISRELADALGPDAAPAIGTPVDRLPGGFVAGEGVADALAEGRTFTLRDLSWKTVAGMAARVDLSAVAARSADGAFGGYRGFGVIHLADLVPWQAPSPKPVESPAPAPVAVEADDTPPPPPPGPALGLESLAADAAQPESAPLEPPPRVSEGDDVAAMGTDALAVQAEDAAAQADAAAQEADQNGGIALGEDAAPADEPDPVSAPPSGEDIAMPAASSPEPDAPVPATDAADAASDAPPAAHPLAAVTARLRAFAAPAGEASVKAGWIDPADREAAERARAARRAAHPSERDVGAWATDAMARFGDTMSAGDRLVADLREHLRREGVETSTEPPPVPAPPSAAEPARPRDALSAADRQTLRDIARALGAREMEEFGADEPAPAQPEPSGETSAPREPQVETRPEPPAMPLRAVPRPPVIVAPPAEPPARPAAAEADPDRTALGLRLAAREAELSEMSSILDTATDGVIVVDERGRLLRLNRSAEALFGYDQKEVAGEPFTLLFATESHPLALDYLEGLKANGVASIMNDGREVMGRVRQGGRIPLFMTMGRIADGPERKFCAVLRDMTAWKKAEGELVEARRAAEKANAHKSDFLATISHEIRTPLNAIIGFAEMMLEERFGPVGNVRYKDYLRDIHASGGHVISLVNDLLDLAKIEAGRMELDFQSVDVNDIVRSCVSLLQGQANRGRVVLRTSLQANLPPVVADERSLRQIALNILSNAVKFTDSGGQIIVSTALTDRGELALRVRDTGIGMSEQDVKAALEPFRQVSTSRRSGGTGLGLPLTKALVEANRGAFAITSRKGEGTLVEILFPPTRVLAN